MKKNHDMKNSNYQNHAKQDQKNNKEHSSHGSHERIFRKRFWISLFLSVPVLVFSRTIQRWLGFKFPEFPGSLWIVPVFSTIIFIYGGIPFVNMALSELRDKKPGMMSLIALAITVSFFYSIATTFFSFGTSFYWELVSLIVIMLLGHWMEMRSVRKASSALDELAKLLPDIAEKILDNGKTKPVKVSALQDGDLILIRPGENIPADGEVIEGKSDVNEALITGESKPVKKTNGSSVIAGSTNKIGSLTVRVTAIGDKTALAGIMRLVREAQESKSSTQLLADKAAGWLFYAALATAAISAVLWTIAEGLNIEVLKRVVTVLVTACPHALGLAIPLVVAISTSLGAENGILVRDRIALEQAKNIDIVVFDKTGTLTEGNFGIVETKTESGKYENRYLSIAAAIEKPSEHLIGKSFVQSAEQKGLDIPEPTEFKAIKGKGVRAVIEDKLYFFGGPRLLESHEIQLTKSFEDFSTSAGKKAQTVIYLIQENSVLAAFAIADIIRPESRKTIEALHDMGVEVAMLTGDSEKVAAAVADELGIDRFFAEVLPEDKDKKISALKERGQKVAMVGDGINDARALSRADIGIAIGSGTDVAVESAGLILVKNNPLDIVRIINLSRETYKKMIQNLIWATGYNVVALPIAAGILAPWGILLSPAVGAIFMSLSTVIVAVNAQFLKSSSKQIEAQIGS